MFDIIGRVIRGLRQADDQAKAAPLPKVVVFQIVATTLGDRRPGLASIDPSDFERERTRSSR